MDHKTSREDARKDFSGYRSIRTGLMVVFSCLTAIPFVVFAFIYFRLETLNTALAGTLIAIGIYGTSYNHLVKHKIDKS